MEIRGLDRGPTFQHRLQQEAALQAAQAGAQAEVNPVSEGEVALLPGKIESIAVGEAARTVVRRTEQYEYRTVRRYRLASQLNVLNRPPRYGEHGRIDS